MKIQRILVPVDYSDCSQAALEAAGQIAAAFGATLDVIHVWDRPTYVSEELKVRTEGQVRTLLDMIRENAEAEMTEFLAKVSLPASVQHSHRLVSGNPSATVLHELSEGKYDLLVVGTHGRTGLRHLMLGSVAETLVRLSPVPVLTIRGSRTAPT
jgi:nucleotide-binding universal stress UspA family protein